MMQREVGSSSDGFSTCGILTGMVQFTDCKFNWKVGPDSSKLIPSGRRPPPLSESVGSWIRHLLFDSNNLLAASPDAHSVECPVAIYPRIEHGPKKSRMSDLVMRQTGWKETGDPSFYADKMPYNIHAPFCPAILFLPFACLVSDNTWTLIYWFCHRFLPLPSIGSQ